MDTILEQQVVIMANIQELQTKVNTLTTTVVDFAASVDEEQAEFHAALDALKALVVNGGTEAERQAIADQLDAAISGLATARADLASTIEAVPPPPPVEPPVEPPTGGGEAGVSGGQQSFRRR